MENEFSQLKKGLSKHDSEAEFQNPPLTKYYLEIPAQNADLSLLLEKPRTYEQMNWQQYKPNFHKMEYKNTFFLIVVFSLLLTFIVVSR